MLNIPRSSLRAAARAGRGVRRYNASVLPSLVSTSSPEFLAKSGAMDELIADYESKVAEVRQGGGAKAQERMRSKGKLLPRERYVHYERVSRLCF